MGIQDVISTEMRKVFPRYTAPLDSACRHSDTSGVMRTPKAQRLYDSLTGTPRKVTFRVPPDIDWDSIRRDLTYRYGSANQWFIELLKKESHRLVGTDDDSRKDAK